MEAIITSSASLVFCHVRPQLQQVSKDISNPNRSKVLSKDCLFWERSFCHAERPSSVTLLCKQRKRPRCALLPSLQTSEPVEQSVRGPPQTSLCCGNQYFGRMHLGGTRRSGLDPARVGEGSKLPDGMEVITSEEKLDAILNAAEEAGVGVVIDWMAQWCRKCIYLAPKIEKLSLEYPNYRFCVVDVNAVPAALVKRGQVTKMPTIQLPLPGNPASWTHSAP
eukprot:TRINITY_DN17170_c1_g1_i2.p1 TRINITY_DN17170_c1_g1~~TRINITY_DN17170_c1_g1_i2.p1  ORF type:complete len:260 (+),score=14.91 TRINITY_DN17170_c1_g1_i2:116-781(+)